MLDIVGIKNNFSINIFNGKKNKEEKSAMGYRVIVEPFTFTDTKYVFNSDNEIFSEPLKVFLENTQEKIKRKQKLSSLSLVKIQIKNTSKKVINGDDFYKNSKLRIDHWRYFVGYIDTIKTKPYIGASIDDAVKNNTFIINFESLKPNDSIYLCFITDTSAFNYELKVLGDTADFNNIPRLEYTNSLKPQNIKNTFCVFLIMLVILLFSFLIFCRINHVEPILKIGFSLEEVQNVK